MPDEGLGVVDAPVDSGIGDLGEPADLAADTGDIGGQPEAGGEPSASTAEEDGSAAADTGPAIIGGKRLSESARQALAPIKTANPALYKRLVHGLFASDRLSRELPGGFKEISDLRAQVEELGGAEGVQRTRAELERWDDFDRKFTEGRAEFIEELTGDPESQQAFLKLVPAAIQKFATLHPEGYKNYIGRVVAGDLQSAGIPLMLERLGDFVGENPRAQEVLARLIGYVNGWGELASKQVEMPKLGAAQPEAAQAQQYQARERALNAREWSAGIQNTAQQVYEKAFARLSNGMKLNDVQKADIGELYRGRIRAAMDQATMAKAKAYLDANDRTGYQRLMSSWNEKNIPAVLSQLIRRTSTAKPTGSPAIPRNGAPPAKPGAPEAGFAWVAKTPANDTIDWNKTSASMVAEGKYCLRGGRKVQCATGL